MEEASRAANLEKIVSDLKDQLQRAIRDLKSAEENVKVLEATNKTQAQQVEKLTNALTDREMWKRESSEDLKVYEIIQQELMSDNGKQSVWQALKKKLKNQK